MARTLLTTGLATNLIMAVMCEEGGTTTSDIVEYVDSDVNTDMTIDASVSVGSDTWKGDTIETIITNGTGYGPASIVFGTNKPNAPYASGVSFFVPCASFTEATGTAGFAFAGGSPNFLGLTGSDQPKIFISGERGNADTGLSTTAAFSFGVIYHSNTDIEFFYGLESGSLSSDSSLSAPGLYGSDADLASIFGVAGSGGIDCETYGMFMFDTVLTEAQFQDLHNDFLGELFEAAAGGANPKGPLGHPLHGPLAGPIGR